MSDFVISLIPPAKESNADSIEPKACPHCGSDCIVHLSNMIRCQQCAHQFSQIIFPILGRKGGVR